MVNLRQKPRPLFALVDPNLDQARRRDVVVPVANFMCGAQAACQLLVIFAQLAEHFLRAHTFFVVVFQLLVLRDIADRTDRRVTDLTRAPRSYRLRRKSPSSARRAASDNRESGAH